MCHYPSDDEYLLTFADLPTGYRSCRVLVVALLAEVTVSTGGEMLALHTDSSAHSSRQLVQFVVELAFPSMTITVARCNQKIHFI